MDKDSVLIFVHIPKTAGASFTQIIRANYSPYEVFSVSNPKINTMNEINENIKCVLGHNYFGQHQTVKSPVYVTMLRDPVERIVSHYYYKKEILKDNKINSLKEFVNMEKYSNLQTRFITGDKPDVDQAIHNLKTFEFFGITEMFNQSLFLMNKTFKWEDTIQYTKKNVNTKKPTNENLPKEVIKQIEKANLLDIQLYKWAKENFEHRIQTLDKNSKIEMEKWLTTFYS